jgi:nucleoside-diphosphate-sugar epimerase
MSSTKHADALEYFRDKARRTSRLLPVPVWALQAGATLLGKGEAVQRLCGNLQLDISKARNLLGWVPPVSVNEGLRRVVATPSTPK